MCGAPHTLGKKDDPDAPSEATIFDVDVTGPSSARRQGGDEDHGHDGGASGALETGPKRYDRAGRLQVPFIKSLMTLINAAGVLWSF